MRHILRVERRVWAETMIYTRRVGDHETHGLVCQHIRLHPKAPSSIKTNAAPWEYLVDLSMSTTPTPYVFDLGPHVTTRSLVCIRLLYEVLRAPLEPMQNVLLESPLMDTGALLIVIYKRSRADLILHRRRRLLLGHRCSNSGCHALRSNQIVQCLAHPTPPCSYVSRLMEYVRLHPIHRSICLHPISPKYDKTSH